MESLEKSSVSKEKISKHGDHQEFEIEPKFEIEGQTEESHSNSKMGNRIESNECSGKNFVSQELEVEPKQ